MSEYSQPSVSYVANSRGEKLAYRHSRGLEPTVVFLCGYASDMEGAKALFLENHCRRAGRAFLRLDYSGHGMSQGEFAQGSIGDWAGDAMTVIDHVGHQQSLLVGSSMGAWIMLLVALARVSKVVGLLGIASAPDFTADLMWERLSDDEQQRLRTDGQLLLSSEYVDDPHPITLKLVEDGNKQRLLNDVIALRCPVRLVHGLQDDDVPWQTSVKLAERLVSTDVELRLIKDGVHRLSRSRDLKLIAVTLDELLERL